MKKFESQAAVAAMFERLIGRADDLYRNTVFYCVDGKPGLWRQVPRTSGGEKTSRPGQLTAMLGNSQIELMRDHEAENELKEAGFGIPPVAVEPPEPPNLPDSEQQVVPDTQKNFPPTEPAAPDQKAVVPPEAPKKGKK